MKLGISAFAWTARFEEAHLRLLPAMQARGFQGFEIPMFDPGALPVKALRQSFASAELECTVCAILPRNINPISADAEVRKKALLHLRLCVETAAELGAKILGGPLFAPIGYLPRHRPRDSERMWAVEAFQSLGSLLDENNITLSIEPVNRSETFFLRTAQEAKALCDSIGHPRIGVTLDTFHANIEEPSLAGAVDTLGSRLKHVHASENDRGLLGTGHIDFPGIVAALTQTGYTGYLMIEGFGYCSEEKNAPGTLWADRNITPEAIACNGIDYLRSILPG